jgi:ankyrin repeat protein
LGGVDGVNKADSATPPTTPDKDDSDYADQKVEATAASSAFSGKVPSVCGPGTAFDRSLLHQAVCEMDIESLQAQLAEVMVATTTTASRSGGGAILSWQDKAGYCPIHTACALRLADPSNAIAASEMVRALLAAGADATIVDRQGNTPLHWAARAGDRDVAEMLLVKNCALDAKNDQGETPLHWGMRSGRSGFEVVVFLLDNGARPSCLNNEYRRPMDVAAEGFLDEEDSIVSLRKRDGLRKEKKMSKELIKVLKDRNRDIRDCRSNYLMRSVHSRTLVLHHPECLEHVPKSSMDWEAPDRVLSIMRRVAPSDANATTGILPHEVTVSTEFERAQLDLLSRVHSTEYLSFVQDLSKDLQKQLKENAGSKKRGGDSGDEASETPPRVVPFTPMVQRSMIKVKESDVKLGINSDTAFSAGSLKAARRAAGAVQHAVDW